MTLAQPNDAGSPCTGVCRIDPQTEFCEGCGRSINEIAAWGLMTAASRADVWALLPARMTEVRRRRPDPQDAKS